MKVTQLALKIFLDEVKSLEAPTERVTKASERWLKLQKEREAWGSSDPYWIALARNELEGALIEYRERLAVIYDVMGDKGLVNFIPTGTADLDEVDMNGKR